MPEMTEGDAARGPAPTGQPAAKPWTFATLAAASRRELEQVLLTGTPPDYDQLEGHTYCGWNHEWTSIVTGRKFKKGFRRRDGQALGYNELIHQDGEGPRGEWRVKLRDGRPRQLGYFRCSRVADEPPGPLYRPYEHAWQFDYNLALNSGIHLPFRVIRDLVVLPNPGDHGLMLGKAYLRLGFRWLNIFYCYFLLGHRQAIEHKPW